MSPEEGHLTDIRTAIVGAMAGQHLAPEKVRKIEIVGAGVQGHLQLMNLKYITSCRDVLVRRTNRVKLDLFKKDMGAEGFNVETTKDTKDIEK